MLPLALLQKLLQLNCQCADILTPYGARCTLHSPKRLGHGSCYALYQVPGRYTFVARNPRKTTAGRLEKGPQDERFPRRFESVDDNRCRTVIVILWRSG